MRHRFTRWLGLSLLTLLLTGCLGKPSAFPAYGTQADALGQVLHQQVTVAYQEPFDKNRALVLFRTDQHPGLSATLLQRAALGKWRMSGAVGLSNGLSRAGALTYSRQNLGQAEEKIGTVTFVRPEGHVIFGEILDPAITWVELTLNRDGAQPVRAKVEDGVWLVKVPPENQNTWFDLRAGNADGLRFSAGFGKRPAGNRGADPATAPLIEYLDMQQGVRLQYPNMGFMNVDQTGHLTITFDAWTVTVERQAQEHSPDLNELLQATVAAAGVPVLEHGIRQAGIRQAGYLLESRPAKDGQGSVYAARYLIPTEHFRYEISCSVDHMYSESVWKKDLEPVCARVLATVQLDER